jgi:hypothetical protein
MMRWSTRSHGHKIDVYHGREDAGANVLAMQVSVISCPSDLATFQVECSREYAASVRHQKNYASELWSLLVYASAR